mmetsp:Transcript_10008/g.24651  ORF Transcript_10008/g.24651 Transcript_10008/m.24651 type:complete len:183 (+) Transcript_10008:1472-2020(+)
MTMFKMKRFNSFELSFNFDYSCPYLSIRYIEILILISHGIAQFNFDNVIRKSHVLQAWKLMNSLLDNMAMREYSCLKDNFIKKANSSTEVNNKYRVTPNFYFYDHSFHSMLIICDMEKLITSSLLDILYTSKKFSNLRKFYHINRLFKNFNTEFKVNCSFTMRFGFESMRYRGLIRQRLLCH